MLNLNYKTFPIFLKGNMYRKNINEERCHKRGYPTYSDDIFSLSRVDLLDSRVSLFNLTAGLISGIRGYQLCSFYIV